MSAAAQLLKIDTSIEEVTALIPLILNIGNSMNIYTVNSVSGHPERYKYHDDSLISLTRINNNATTEEPRSANELPTSSPNGERSALRSLARRYRARRRRKLRADNADPAERRKRKRASEYFYLRDLSQNTLSELATP